MSRQRRKHRGSVRRSKRRRNVRRMAAQWRWTHNYWGPDVYGAINWWHLKRALPKLMGAGMKALKQDALVPRLLIHDQLTMVVAEEEQRA